MLRLSTRVTVPLLLLGLVFASSPATAEPRTTSDLLLPYFEVDLSGGGRTTLFALGNAHDRQVQVRTSVESNWGIPVLGVTLTLEPGQVRTVNLRDWIGEGELPNRTLGPDALAHVQAALTGQPSPKDGMYYSTQVDPFNPTLAAGFITLRVQSSDHERPDSLWGDYFWVDDQGEAAGGELLVDIDTLQECRGLCDRHLVRFLEGGAFDGGTELVIWAGGRTTPSPTPEPVYLAARVSGEAFYDEPGNKFDERILELLPTQVIALSELDLAEPFGWIDVATEEPVYVGVRHRAENRFSVSVQSWCVEEPPPPPRFRSRPSIEIQKLTAGADADLPPGPALQIGSEVIWEYVVRNTGNVRLSGIVVSDNRGVTVQCPRTGLGLGETMTCTGSGSVLPGQYANIGTVTANPPSGSAVTDSDPSHYLGVEFIVGEPAVALEKLVNGQDADTPPGPAISQGSPVTWSYIVTNTGGVGLSAVNVTDSDPAVSVTCPESALAVGDSMICTASGTAVEGPYTNTGSVTASGGGQSVAASDPAHHFGLPAIVVDAPAIGIEKLTNGFDADGVASAPQLHHGHPVIWTYVVTNTGNVALSNVAVTDDRGVEVSCPKTTLEPGEQMLCTGSGTAVASEECYENVGTVVGTPPQGDNVTDSDPSHYCAEEIPGETAIDIEKHTNGENADVAPGPALTVGDAVQWVYVVTNTGDVTLTGVTVTDDQGVSVTCAGGQPFVLEPAQTKTCFANGVAEVGQYANVGTATGTPEGGGEAVTDSDPSHYLGGAEGGDEGCTPGYWKNHTDSWAPTGYSPSQAVDSVFTTVNVHYGSLGDETLLDALSFAGGSGASGAAEILLRAAVAALLNASHPDVAYPRTPAEVIADVDTALGISGSTARDSMLTLAAALDADNNLGCPLN